MKGKLQLSLALATHTLGLLLGNFIGYVSCTKKCPPKLTSIWLLQLQEESNRLKITFPSNCRVEKDTCSVPKLVDKFKDFHFSFCLLPQPVSVFCAKKASHINAHLIYLVLITDLFTVFGLFAEYLALTLSSDRGCYFTWNWNSFPCGY